MSETFTTKHGFVFTSLTVHLANPRDKPPNGKMWSHMLPERGYIVVLSTGPSDIPESIICVHNQDCHGIDCSETSLIVAAEQAVDQMIARGQIVIPEPPSGFESWTDLTS